MEKFVSDVLEKWKEVVMACFKIPSQHLPRITKEHSENSHFR
jgi:hypothetical protein